MSVEILAVLCILAFLVLILLEVPIGLSLGIAATIGILQLRGVDVATSTLAATPFSATAKYALFVIPMFVLLGALIANAGIAGKIFGAVNRLVSWLPGGLAAATVLATMIFSGISGSSAADVATIGRISVGEMSRHGYSARFAAAVVAAAGTFAVLIPPSIVLVIYGIIAGESIGALLLAGIVPGIISAVVLVGYLVIHAVVTGRSRPAAGEVSASGTVAAVAGAGTPRGEGGVAVAIATEEPEQVTAPLSGLIYAAVLFLIVAGGIYSGVFTATEAGAIGAFAALVIALVARRAGDLPIRRLLLDSIRETANVTSMIFLLLIGGAMFAFFIASANVPATATRWVLSLPVSPTAVVAILLVVMLVMGTFLDGLSILLLTVPIAAPIVTDLGFDGIWFGVLAVKAIEVGLITPPVGVNVFIICGLVEDARVEDVFRSVTPLVVLDIAITAVFFAFPGLVTWLPRAASLS